MLDEAPLDFGIQVQRYRAGQAGQETPGVEPFGHDRHQAPARTKPFPGRPQVTCSGLAIVTAFQPVRIGRVHQYQARHQRGIEQFVDQFAIVASEHGLGEQRGQAFAAARRDLVERKSQSRPCSPMGQHAGAGRGLEQDLARGNCSGARGKPSDPGRRRKLLQFDLFFAADGLGRQQGVEPAEMTLGDFDGNGRGQFAHPA